MTRRQVLVQLDDDLVEALDRVAEEQQTNRSELLRRGARAVIEAAELTKADDALRGAYQRHPQDIALVETLARHAAATVPEW